LLRDRDIGTASQEAPSQFEPEIHEMYVDLMCEFEPSAVIAFLKDDDTCRTEQTLEVRDCCKHSVLLLMSYVVV
jgi:hypothetical protein